MEKYEDCEVCGERYWNEFIQRYLTETIVGTGNGFKVITHCKSCKPKKDEWLEKKIKSVSKERWIKTACRIAGFNGPLSLKIAVINAIVEAYHEETYEYYKKKFEEVSNG
jgi:hypothetical protein